MIRNLKVLGLALGAMFAMSAMLATAASAELGEVTSPEGEVHVIGTSEDTGNDDAFHAFGNTITCNHDTFFLGEINGTQPNGEHKPLPLTPKQRFITVSAIYTGCTSGTQPATVTMNGCDYQFDTVLGIIQVVCPPGKTIEIHRYSSHTNHTSGTSNCTTTVNPGEYGSVTYTNNEDGTVTANGAVTGISAQTHGACSFGFTVNTSEATYTLNNDVIAAENEAEEQVPVHVG